MDFGEAIQVLERADQKFEFPVNRGRRPAVGARALSDRKILEKAGHRHELPKLHVIQHTDRNLLSSLTRGIRCTVSAFGFVAGKDALVVRSSTSRSGRACRARSRHGCAMPQHVRRSRLAARGLRLMR
jgi:hypothetical protein